MSHLFDAPGSHHMRAESIAPFGMEYVSLFQRQVALVDVDEGKRSKAEVPRKDPNVVTPSSYVFDVFRTSGAKMHTYCFHGAVDDKFEVNVKNRKFITGKGDDPDEEYLRGFRYRDELKEPNPDDVEWAGDCDGNVLQATWRVARWKELGNRPEAKMYFGKHGGAMTTPRKYNRLHLFEPNNCRILHGICQDRVRWNEHNVGKPMYGVGCLFAQRRFDEPADNVFVALIEPYAGKPFISERKLLGVKDNETDARRAVAVEVKTTNEHTDILYADAWPRRQRRLSGGIKVSAEYAYISTDPDGLRHLCITNGTLLKTSEFFLEVARSSYGGKVTDADYLKRRFTIDGYVPEYFAGHFFEAGGDYRRTSYEVKTVQPSREKKRTLITLRKGMEIMSTRVRSVDPETASVIGAIAMIRVRGRDRDLVASTDDLKKFWRVAYIGGNRHTGHIFRLSHLDPNATGPIFTEKDFPPGSGLSIWEFGVGDKMHIRTGVSLRRLADRKYEVYATSPFKFAGRLDGARLSYDRKSWQPLKLTKARKLRAFEISEDVLLKSNCRFFIHLIWR